MERAGIREEIAAELDRHRRDEGAIVEAYHALLDQLGEGPLSVLLDHVATEEEMHHFLLGTLSDWLRAPESRVEALEDRRLDKALLLDRTRELRGHERQTIEACRSLTGRLPGQEGALVDALLEGIATDSEKHDRLLATLEALVAGRGHS